MTNGKNPYIERGLVLSPDEYNLASGALTLLADHADANSHPEVRGHCVKLIVRMKHIVHAGEGMTPEVTERYGRRIAKAVELGKPEAIERGVADLLAASLRLDADPAEKIGLMLAQLCGQSVQSLSRQITQTTLTELDRILADAGTDWERDGWPTPAEILAWLRELVSLGAQNVAEGHDPWVGDDSEGGEAGAVADDAAGATP